ncbi:ABC transporter ATP-binding protein [Rhodoluna lacicola]|uniref:ABC-type quaternary amine transporter n=1 Tax=Rhodoluna lacicola TaxID=529884 RepID=A0A060JEF3_9MICO|nr:ABC transporter ATP-binding protein [Rhodoluna lacicola]AIC46972.1 ABC-type spermidine/putrescine transport systems, ATPase component [Rhodoluna lacicola]BDS49860.1 ABC transporter [Rhodoluna lacicola]
MPVVLSLQSVNKTFAGQPVLSNLNLDVHEKEFLAVLGSSGSGKTTLLRLISGFDSPDSGEIHINNRVVFGKGINVLAEERRVGFVPQDAALFPHLSVSKNIEFGLTKLSATERSARVTELLRLVDLVGFEERMPHELSGGQRHRVALARALAPKPDLILLDEPFSSLDAELRVRLREDVRKVIAKAGITAIMVTHDQEEALSMASRVAILRDGEFAQIGNPSEIYQSPTDIEMATFLGDSVIINGVIENEKIVTDLGLLTPLNKVVNGATGRVAIRPENFYLQPNPNGDGEVIGRQYFGHDALVEVKLPTLVIQARANGPFAPELGMKVTVWVRGQVNFYTD